MEELSGVKIPLNGKNPSPQEDMHDWKPRKLMLHLKVKNY